jgi:hypothetical protein
MDAAFVRERSFGHSIAPKGAKGMGIGAYQVRHLVRLAGGEADVTSVPAEGTVFRPRRVHPDAASEPERFRDPESVTGQTALREELRHHTDL